LLSAGQQLIPLFFRKLELVSKDFYDITDPDFSSGGALKNGPH
jgi:hypothetical protein